MRSIAPSPPRNYDALKELLLARREELPRRLVQVAAFALENPDEIAFGTVASVAAQADVQPSTLAAELAHAYLVALQAKDRNAILSIVTDDFALEVLNAVEHSQAQVPAQVPADVRR